MRKVTSLMLVIVLISAAAAYAAPGYGKGSMSGLKGVTGPELLAAVPSAADKTPQEWTLEERLAIASVFSISMQESLYIRHAGMSSFMIPGAGQFMTGQAGAGALHLGAEFLIAGAAIAGMWYLTPADLMDHTLTWSQRHTLVASYMTPERIVDVLPAAGVAAGTWALSLVNRAISARGAIRGAQENLADGSVSFEPIIGLGSLGGGFRLSFH